MSPCGNWCSVPTARALSLIWSWSGNVRFTSSSFSDSTDYRADREDSSGRAARTPRWAERGITRDVNVLSALK
jgi:hypothetical protein